MSQTEQKKKPIKMHKPGTIERAEYAMTTHVAVPGDDISVEDMLDPNYWGHVATTLKPGDIIWAIPKDRRYFAEFLVMGRGKLWTKVRLLRQNDFTKDSLPELKHKYVVEFIEEDQWRVRLGQNVISRGHNEEMDANEWLKKHKEELTG